MKTLYLILIGLMMPLFAADYVELRDGRRLEGRIVLESPEEIHIQVAANEAGTIRQVFIIHAREVRTWSSSGVSPGEDPETPEERLSGIEYVERLLRDAESFVARKEYDSAIETYQAAEEAAGQEIPGHTEEQRVASLEMRAHALRLLGAALDAKINHLNSLARGGDAEIRAERQRLEREWSRLQEDKRQAASDRAERGRRIEIGSRHQPNDHEERERNLRTQIQRLNEREAHTVEFSRALNEEIVKTDAMIRINRERISQATSVAREARRQLSRRR